jgi:hypothetical protein
MADHFVPTSETILLLGLAVKAKGDRMKGNVVQTDMWLVKNISWVFATVLPCALAIIAQAHAADQTYYEGPYPFGVMEKAEGISEGKF